MTIEGNIYENDKIGWGEEMGYRGYGRENKRRGSVEEP